MTSLRPPDWTEEALCAQSDPDAWYGGGDEPLIGDYLSEEEEAQGLYPSQASTYANEAKAICRQCPVVYPCLMRAIDNDERYGIWGAMTHRERETYKRRLAIPA